jgi:N-acetylneuraminic acid mutarotase
MIVWGGADSSNILGNSGYLNTGGRYDPRNGTWRATNTTGAPGARSFHTAVWTNHEMIVWGGDVSGQLSQEGGRYDPRRDLWQPLSTTDAPVARRDHAAVWTGREMVIWGGNPSVTVPVPADPSSFLSNGARYDPRQNLWFPISSENAPSSRYAPTMIWTGFELVVWGGANGQTALDTGGRLER